MSQINDFTLGTISIEEKYNISATSSIDSTPYFNQIDDEFIISYIKLEKVTGFAKFEYDTIGTLQTRYLETYYRISRNGNDWTTWLVLEESIENFPPWDPLDRLWIDIKFIRKGNKTDGSIRLIEFKIDGSLLRDVDSEDDVSVVQANKELIIKSPYIYKVFRIDDIEVIPLSNQLDIKYRFSQDNSRSWSNWEPLTKENISTKRINPIRFFQIEYLVKNNGSSFVKIQDINLIGDFQNVTLDSKKTNLFGIRECCQSNLISNSSNNTNPGTVDENGNFIPNTSGFLDGNSCSSDNQFKPMTSDEKSTLYNPYQQTQASNLLNKLSNDAMEVFGWQVQYFVTDPDSKGIDYSLHEYGLFNIVCESKIKVAVDNNQFPDNQILMNQFDLNLFDSFEVHITKEMFKMNFGVERRPSKEDLIYFCDINRLFIVDHAQQFRNFNNYAVYYKVVLRKYNKAANVNTDNVSIKDRISQLTNNSTIDQLFGIENNQDKASISNKKQLQPLTRDPIRLSVSGISINSLIVKDIIENSTTVISKQHYDLSNALIGGQNNVVTDVIKYTNVNNVLRVSDNIGFSIWFNINNYVQGEVYNLFNFYDVDNSLGWSVNLIDDSVQVKLNGDNYLWNLSNSPSNIQINENVWYCYVLNIDQRKRYIDQYIYKRNVDIESDAKYLPSTILDKVYFNSQPMTPSFYEIDINASISISDIKITNIRLFDDIIPESTHNKLLNQYLIADDSKHLVFADNASMKLNLPIFKDNSQPWD